MVERGGEAGTKKLLVIKKKEQRKSIVINITSFGM
jgi:hypothetical protein